MSLLPSILLREQQFQRQQMSDGIVHMTCGTDVDSFSAMNYHNSVILYADNIHQKQSMTCRQDIRMTMHCHPAVYPTRRRMKVYGYIWDRLLGDVLSIDIMGSHICYNIRILAFFPGSQRGA